MNKKSQAQQLYLQGCITQKEIAEQVGVSERTVWTWIHQFGWDKLRLAAYQAPITIADNLCSQIVELQNAIARKAPGCRYPTLQEAEIMRKLIVMLEKMKKTPSLSQNMQVLETFRNYVRPLDKDFSRKLGNYTEQFMEGKATNSYAPYQAEYGVDPVPPVSPNAHEPEEDVADAPAVQPCPDINTCLHEGNCTYPKCLHPERYAPRVDPATRYRIPSLHYQLHMPGLSPVADHIAETDLSTETHLSTVPDLSTAEDLSALAEVNPQFYNLEPQNNADKKAETDSNHQQLLTQSLRKSA